MSTSTVSVSYVSSESLPSQDGRRGRPRMRGRATVMGAGLPLGATQRALAEQYQVKASLITHYPRESGDDRQTFVIPGLDAQTRQVFAGSLVTVEAAPASDEASADSAVADAPSES